MRIQALGLIVTPDQGKFRVIAVGELVEKWVKVGDTVESSDLDDFEAMGIKVKEIPNSEVKSTTK